MSQAEARLRLFLAPPHDCNYLPERQAAEAVLEPGWAPDPRQYARLLALGFRRSGQHLYRPHCQGCRACVATRLAVQAFHPDRSQRRCLRRNADLRLRSVSPTCSREYFDLYQRYLATRHPQGGMDDPTPEQFLEFLTSPWSQTWFHELRQDGRLVAVAVTDQTEDALSAVYTFYDPELNGRGLGTYAVLAQVDLARRLALPYLYLGYWIGDCDKMRYKQRFRPLELAMDGAWKRIGPGQRMPDPVGFQGP